MVVFTANCNQRNSDGILIEDIDNLIYITVCRYGRDSCDVELTQESSLELAHAIIAHYAKEK